MQHYYFDYSHYGISSLIESIRYYLVNNVWPRFRTNTISPYHKFIASLIGKDVNLSTTSPSVIKEVSSLGTETILKPALNIDANNIEMDDIVSPHYFNYAGMNTNMESAINRNEVAIIDNNLVLMPQLMYVRYNLDCIAIFNSYYEKLDFDVKLIQSFKGLNRVTEPFITETFIPVPSALLSDFPLVNWSNFIVQRPNKNTKMLNTITKLINHTGQTRPHIVYAIKPKFVLQSISDASEKYGGDKLPEFKTSFNITVEGYIPTSLVVLRNYRYVGSFLNMNLELDTNTYQANILLNLLHQSLIFLSQLFGFVFTTEDVFTLLFNLLQQLNFTDISELFYMLYHISVEHDLQSLQTFVNALQTAIQNQFNVQVNTQILMNVISNLGQTLQNLLTNYHNISEEVYSGVPLLVFNTGEKCLTDNRMDDVDLIFHRIANNVIAGSTYTINATEWKINNDDVVITIFNAPTGWEVDNNANIIIKGPLIKDIPIAILVKRAP